MPRIGNLHVRHDEKLRRKSPGSVEEREVFLVLPHGEDQALLRHLEKGGIEAAGIDLRPFHQRRDLIEELGIAAETRILFGCLGLQLPLDLRSPRGVIGDHHAVALKPLGVLLRVREPDRALAHEAVPRGRISRFQPQHLPRHDARSVHHHQTVHRPYELRVACPPAHRFRNRQRLQRLRHHRGERPVQHCTLDFYSRDDDRPLGGLALLEVFRRDAVLASEAGNGLRRRLCRGAGDCALTVFTPRRDIGDGERHAARRGINARRACPFELRFAELARNALGKRFRKQAERLGRQLLGKQLDEQRGARLRHAPAESPSVRALRNSLAPRRARAPARGRYSRRAP